MIRIAGAVTFAALALSCATTSVRKYPDGWMQIDCGGSMRRCKQEAGRRCPMGYEEAGEGGEVTGSKSVATTSFGVTTIRTRDDYEGSMILRCKQAAHDPETP